MITQHKTVIRGISSANTIEYVFQDLPPFNGDDSIYIGTQTDLISHQNFDPEEARIISFVGPPACQPPAPHQVSVGWLENGNAGDFG